MAPPAPRPAGPPPYRLLDHTADLAFEVEATDWPGLLAAASAALGDLLRAADGRPSDVEEALEVEGADPEDVLVAWLTEAVVRLETRRFLVRGAALSEAGATRARGVLTGRRFDPAAEALDRVVKAVTYHDLRVLAGGGGRPWRAAIVLDL